MKVRRALAEDAFALAKLHLETWQAAYRGIVPDAYLDSLSLKEKSARFCRFLEIEHERDIHTFVAEDNGRIRGFITYGTCRDCDADPDLDGEVYAIYVAPSHWRAGIGKLMLRHAEGRMKAANLHRCYIWVLESNTSAREFYRDEGYIEDGESRFAEFGKPLSVIRYRKNLVLTPRPASLSRAPCSLPESQGHSADTPA